MILNQKWKTKIIFKKLHITKLDNISIRNLSAREEIIRKIRKYLEPDNNENMAYQVCGM